MALVDYESVEEDYNEEDYNVVSVYIMENKKQIYVDIDDVAYDIINPKIEIGRKWGNLFVPKEIDNDVKKMERLIWKNVPVNNDFHKSWALMKTITKEYFKLKKIKLE